MKMYDDVKVNKLLFSFILSSQFRPVALGVHSQTVGVILLSFSILENRPRGPKICPPVINTNYLHCPWKNVHKYAKVVR